MIAADVLLHAHHAAVILAGAKPKPSSSGAGLPSTVLHPQQIPGLSGDLNMILGWGEWLEFFLGTGGLLMCAAQMAIGRRQRHSWAADGAAGIPWVIAGLALTSIAAGLVTAVLK